MTAIRNSDKRSRAREAFRCPQSDIRNPKRVVGYIRGSTEEQQNTLTAQRDQITAYCSYKGLELVECFVDEGESAFSVGFYERPAAARMVSSMGELHAGAIIITKLDRGFRDALDCLFTLDQLEKQGIGLHLLDIQLDPDSPVGKLLITMMAAIAEFENKRRSERQKAAFTVMRAQGKRCGGIPYGWDPSPSASSAKSADKTALIPNPAEQLILHKIVRWIEREEECVSAIARYLNAGGTPTKKGGKWHPATVASVYKHRRLGALPEEPAPEENVQRPTFNVQRPTEEAA